MMISTRSKQADMQFDLYLGTWMNTCWANNSNETKKDTQDDTEKDAKTGGFRFFSCCNRARSLKELKF